MKEYMLIFRNEKNDSAAKPSAEQMQAMMQQWQSWITGIAKQGKFGGTNRLLPEGKTIRPGKAISDGPYVEAKEYIGGYLILKANSIDEATELAKDCPVLKMGGNVEVRYIMPIESDVKSPNFLAEKVLA